MIQDLKLLSREEACELTHTEVTEAILQVIQAATKDIFEDANIASTIFGGDAVVDTAVVEEAAARILPAIYAEPQTATDDEAQR